MPFAEWTENLSVGVAAFDEQHRAWFGFINEFYEALVAGASDDAVRELLDRVVSFARQHFADEERFLVQHAYPGLEAHKAAHVEFLARLDQLVADPGALRPSIAAFQALRQWIMTHLQQADWEYGAFLASKGIIDDVPA